MAASCRGDATSCQLPAKLLFAVAKVIVFKRGQHPPLPLLLLLLPFLYLFFFMWLAPYFFGRSFPVWQVFCVLFIYFFLPLVWACSLLGLLLATSSCPLLRFSDVLALVFQFWPFFAACFFLVLVFRCIFFFWAFCCAHMAPLKVSPWFGSDDKAENLWPPQRKLPRTIQFHYELCTAMAFSISQRTCSCMLYNIVIARVDCSKIKYILPDRKIAESIWWTAFWKKSLNSD